MKHAKQQVIDLLDDAETRLSGKFGAPDLFEIEDLVDRAFYIVLTSKIFDDEIDSRIDALFIDLDA